MTKKLNKEELNFIKEMCYIWNDDKLLVELNRIRESLKESELVTIHQVREARYKLGIKKTSGVNAHVKKKKKK
jgi:hypothetical protein